MRGCFFNLANDENDKITNKCNTFGRHKNKLNHLLPYTPVALKPLAKTIVAKKQITNKSVERNDFNPWEYVTQTDSNPSTPGKHKYKSKGNANSIENDCARSRKGRKL